MPESQAAQRAPEKLDFEKDFKLINRYRIPYVECGCMADATKQEEKKDGQPTKERIILSIENRSKLDPKIRQISKKTEMSIEIRQSPEFWDITLMQAYRSIGRAKEIIIPEDRIAQIVESLSRSCLDLRNNIYDSPSRTINFFVKLKIKKIDTKGVFVYQMIMTKGKKFKVVILDLDDPNAVKGLEGQLFAIDCSLKY